MIEIINRQRKHKIKKNKYKSLLKRLVEHYKLEKPEVTLAFVNNKTIEELNFTFLNKKAPTDVLSFPIREKAADGKFYLGDIIISAREAYEQAIAEGHPLERELEILVIHGFLHLLGFEHAKGLEQEEEHIQNLLFEGKHGNRA
jgi:probable rRNA maturation factor